MIRLVGGPTFTASTRAARGAPATPPVGASLMANIRFARALGWTSRRLERQMSGPRLYLVGGAPGTRAHAARRASLR
jgi:hypothetical protein